ncbi:MAG: helix-turn-helix domain-containing protein [Chloroflexi bacterium]|nr:helix-turn-helix domain-containing protein [Chloroflexota bacterium]MCI0649972.1 helix-turn-helix domain-containing protein [Chloroflexota bacterium]MCI0725769.1 helix-turn-helix domain-containing protein [Chloroflexota bacterium]
MSEAVRDLEPDVIMTVQEVSAYLKLAESTVYKLAREGKLPGRKVGGAWRFSRKGLERWMEQTPFNNQGT